MFYKRLLLGSEDLKTDNSIKYSTCIWFAHKINSIGTDVVKDSCTNCLQTEQKVHLFVV